MPVKLEEEKKKFFGEFTKNNCKELNDENNAISKFKMNLKDPSFMSGNWCYDTPGTVNEQQVFLLSLKTNNLNYF